jgi:single-strand DNA-binding protein
MAGYNRVIMMGNLTRTPEYKQLASGQGVCNFGLATSRPMRSKSGEGNAAQEVCFIDVAVWGPQAETCKKYLDKGSSVLVEGRLRQESWTDQTGGKRSKHAIVADRVNFVRSANASQQSQDQYSGEIDMDNEEAFKDELPF